MGYQTPDGPTDLYRYFDKDGALLYVGVSFHAMARAAQHRSSKHWWSDAVFVKIEHCATRSEAFEAEAHAVKTESPRHNIKGTAEERAYISKAARESAQRRRAQGFRLGAPVQLPEATRRLIAQLRAEGKTYRAIVAVLNEGGYATARGGVWQPATVKAVIDSIALDGSVVILESSLNHSGH